MILKAISSIAFLLSTVLVNKDPNGEAILKEMHDRYANKWYRNYTFNQTTVMYHNDSLKKTETWYEAVQFPDHFRIDFGVADSMNSAVFKNDSAYYYKNGKLRTVRKDENDLTFLLGGMYFYSFPSAVEKVKSLGYNLSKAHEDVWKGKPVYVIGAAKGEQTNQLWIDKQYLILVRMITFDHNRKLEGVFEDHIKLNGGWTETKALFYFDGKLAQVEKYHDCRTDVNIEPSYFEPVPFTKAAWHK